MLGLGRGRDWVEGEKGAVGLVGLGWGEVGCGRGAVEYSERRGAAWRSVAQRGAAWAHRGVGRDEQGGCNDSQATG